MPKFIMVAEDEDELIEMYRDFFAIKKELKDATIDYVKDTREFKASVCAKAYDLIILDLGLGYGQPPPGLGLLEEYRGTIKVIVISGYDEYREQCLKLGAVDFFKKPADLRVVLQSILKNL